MDPSGEFRYIWHAIGQPTLISFLNFNCTNFGNYFSLVVIVSITLFVSYLLAKERASTSFAIFFTLIVFALQVKQGFRPETTAILISLIAEYYRAKDKVLVWMQFALLLAWIQPTVFIIYGFYVLATNSSMQWRTLFTEHWKWLPVALLINGLFIYLYPYEITDLFEGLILNAKTIVGRNDGDIFTYHIRSDFFPLFGVAFFLAYGLQIIKNKALIIMIPLIWYFSIRVPPTYYNIVPLYIVILYNLLGISKMVEVNFQTPHNWKVTATLVFSAFLAFVGVLQGNLRDINSFMLYRSTLDNSIATYQRIIENGKVPCKVPSFFTLFLPSDFFAPSFEPASKLCDGKNFGINKVNMIQATGRSGISPDRVCIPWPKEKGANFLDKIFKSDSGYSFYVCDID